MTELSGPEGRTSPIERALRPASAVADVEAVQLRNVIHLKLPGRQTPPEPPPAVAPLQFATNTGPRAIGDVHHVASRRVVDLIREMSGMKNVPIAPEHHAAMAADILEVIPFTQVYQLAGFEEAGVIAGVLAVNAKLDEVFMVRVLRLIAEARGADVADPAVTLIATEMFTAIEAKQPDRRCIRWPDPAKLICAHNAALATEHPETCDA
jgi:hypothetical protein